MTPLTPTTPSAPTLEPVHPGAASVHEAAGGLGALPSRIKPVSPSLRVHGPAFPVRCPPGDNLWLHRAIVRAPGGSVLVVDVGGDAEFGYWGEVMSQAARTRGILGLVIDGGVRDCAAISSLGFPVFSNGISIRSTNKNPQGDGAVGMTVTIGGVAIHTGDHVVGDADGVVVVPAHATEDCLLAARQREHDEVGIVSRLTAGETTLDIYGLPA